MKHALTLLWVLLFVASGRSFAQSSFCHFDSIWQQKSLEDSLLTYKHNAHVNRVNQFRQNTQFNYNVIPHGTPPPGLGSGSGCRNSIFVIPVVVHVVYDPTIPQSNLHDSLIEKQIALLNKAFANEVNPSNPFGVNTGIQFCLAKKNPFGGAISGINHISDTSPVNIIFNDSQKNHLAGLAYYDNQRYLNIWVVPDIDGAAGYSSAPYVNGVDGVVMEYNYFGDYTDCSTCGFDNVSRGQILAHEIGHFLGLFHPFQGECVGTTASTCAFQGDFCCDTRPTKENHNCPVPSVNQCLGLTYYGSQGDNYENLMTYADDACRDNFTPDQVSVMHSVLSNDRKRLVSVDNVNSLALSCCLSVSWFNIDNGFLCEPGDITFQAIEHTSVNYRWLVYNDTVQVLDTTLSTATFSWTLSRYSTYHVKLFVITGSDSVVLERTNLIELRDCGPIMTSTQGNWYFGQYAGLQFRTGGPVLDLAAFDGPPPTVNSGDGGLSYSNRNGDLLFYAGGDSAEQNLLRLYRPDPITGAHIQVFPKTPLYGHQSSSQIGIVIPFTNDSTRFHLFVTDAYEKTSGCYHNVLDIDTPHLVMNNFANLPIPAPIGSDTNDQGTILSMEIITTVPACNGNHWLIFADGGRGANERKLLVYLVTDSSITYVTQSDDQVPIHHGQLKASPDGTKLAAPGIVFNFDRANGAITTFKKFPNQYPSYEFHGTSFSPDSRLLYYVLNEAGVVSLYQYDLESADSMLSRKLVSQISSFFAFSLQLGPDNELYLAKAGNDELAVISFPDSVITTLAPNACGFEEFGPSLRDADGNGGRCFLGLPNMMDAMYPQDVPLGFSILDSACGNVKFSPNDACAGTYLWYFGDGDSSLVRDPIHTYSDTGMYTVTLTVNGSTQISRDVRIGIDRPQIAGDTSVSCNLSDLTTYSIANLNPRFEYNWSIDGGEIVLIEDFANARVRWDTIGSLVVTAINTTNQCTSSDTIIVRPSTIADNTLTLNSETCFPGVPFTFAGSLPEINFMGDSLVHYQWQTWNAGAWHNTSANDTLIDFDGVTHYDSMYYRRKAFSQFCENYSDSILVVPNIRITQHPADVSRCIEDGSAIRKFFLGAEFTDSWHPYKAYFVVKKFIDLVGDVYEVEDSTDYLNYPNSLDSVEYDLTYLTYEYFFKISTPCGDYYSDTALIHGCYAGNWSVLMPDTVYTTEDSLVTLITHNDHCTGGPLLDGSYTYWQYSNNGTDWITINDTCGDTLRFTASYCENGFYYRTVFHEPCANEDRYSPVARLFVTRTNFAKLMMRDYYDDGGTEPNYTTDWRNLYDPPSLLIRLDDDGGTEHQTPDWALNDTAYVYYTIRNIGSDTSKPANLKMYWTFGGPHGADWSIAWQDVAGNRFYNNHSGSGLAYQQWHPYGDNINEVPIVVPPIAPGDSIRTYFPWGAFPNPLRYYTMQNGNYHYANPRVMCLLARIETCPVDSFGLAQKETSSTRQNIINNSRIVGRNTSVTNVQWLYGKKEVELTVRRFAGDNEPLRVTMQEVGTCGFALYGRVKAVLSDALWEAWRDGGYAGSGYSIDSYGILSVTDLDDFEIANIDLDPDSVALLTFEFELTSNPFVTLNCRYAVAQYQGETSLTPYGTFVMNVNAIGQILPVERTESESKLTEDNNDSLSNYKRAFKETKNTSDESEDNPVFSDSRSFEKTLFAYPNPFSNEVNFYFELEDSQSVGFEIYNSLGALVGTISSRTYPDGAHKIAYDGSHLAPGMYLCKVKLGEESKTIRLVIVR